MINSNYWSAELERLEQLMPYRVQHVLLIASLYDSFVFEVDGFLAEQVASDFYLLNLSTQPGIFHASGTEGALKLLELEKIDIVVVHLASMRTIALELLRAVKDKYPDTPVFFLLGAPLDLMFVENHIPDLAPVDDFFYWNGDSKLFLAMIKLWEEHQNLQHDTSLMQVPVILVIETFIPYYSQFLPLFLELILQLNQSVVRGEHQDVNKALYMKARPRVILLHDYQTAVETYEKYSGNVIGIISNINYDHRAQTDRDAGLRLLQYIRKRKPTLPFLLQSFNPMYRDIVTASEGDFLYKDLPGLRVQVKRWLESEVGFGRFVFRGADHVKIDEAGTLIGFVHRLSVIPDDSLEYHYRGGHICNWLKTHAELALAEYIGGLKDYQSVSQLRDDLCEAFSSLISFRRREKIQDWNEEADLQMNLIYKIGDDSIGGKGRGLAFLNVMLNRYSDICEKYQGVNISVPVAAILATGEFDKFINANPMLQGIGTRDDLTDKEIDELFLECTIPYDTLQILSQVIEQTRYPLAIRSSSVLEDSITNPFAGVFRTFLIPNSHTKDELRLQQLIQAVKLVYASMYLKGARVYRESLRIPSREEKMAVIIQKVAGSMHGDYFYPLVSGVAQSYNYYPSTNMKHEDGVVTLSTGLGKTAVERERTFAFCPRYPNKDMFTAINIVEGAQRRLYAIMPEKRDFDLRSGEDSSLERLRISQALLENELELLSSVWDHDNKEFIAGKYAKGPRVITYRSLLHYRQYPLADILKDFLELGRLVMGCEIEMEFAFDVDNRRSEASFYLLQIRPITVSQKLYSSSLEHWAAKREQLLAFSSYALGSEMDEELDIIVYIHPSKFDIIKTEEIAAELKDINQQLKALDKKYILAGAGRWGSSDRFLGVPVAWSQISAAKLIIEVVLPNMSIEASHGSHFFHNLFSMNVGYLTIWDKAAKDFIDWDAMEEMEPLITGKYISVCKYKASLKILFDGKNAVILK